MFDRPSIDFMIFGFESREKAPAKKFGRSNMAMHVPRAPGFAQMLKDGAKVSVDFIFSMWKRHHTFQIFQVTSVIHLKL